MMSMLKQALEPTVMSSAMKVAAIVGPLIILLNQWELLSHAKVDWFKCLFSFVIPYTVSTVSLIMARSQNKTPASHQDDIQIHLSKLVDIVNTLAADAHQVLTNASTVNKRSQERSTYMQTIVEKTKATSETNQIIFEHIDNDNVSQAIDNTKLTAIEIAAQAKEQTQQSQEIVGFIAKMAESSQSAIKGSAANMKIGQALISNSEQAKAYLQDIQSTLKQTQ